MEAQKQNKRTRGGRLIAGALVGTVLSIGAVAGSASADSTPVQNTSTVTIVKTGVGTKVVGGAMSMMSGIRW